MSVSTGLMSSDTDQWFTPQPLVDSIRSTIGLPAFDLDVAAGPGNAKAPRFFTIQDNALEQAWTANNAWLNPPYGRAIQSFAQKAIEEVKNGNCQHLTMLVPARTDTVWFQSLAEVATNIIFLKGRVKFINPLKGDEQPAPFPSAVIFFSNKMLGAPTVEFKKL